ncbi:hypothetical protein Tco_0702449 [Tanacetum coccineum]|uniref:Uncharacterized protein n=1 Tax=Tanacetum coccineum TaxID=301880 RepID=A0ABQ4XXK0_9ASTR
MKRSARLRASQEDLFGHDARPRPPGKQRPAKKSKSDATESTGGSSASAQFGELMVEGDFVWKREAAERAFEAQAKKTAHLMRLEGSRADSHGWSSGFFSMASLASSIFIFIVKSLQFEHSVFPGLSAALEDPEEELAREEEFEGVVGPEKELAFPKVISSFHLKFAKAVWFM